MLLTKLKNFWQRRKSSFNPRSGLGYVVVIFLLAMTWSGIKAVQTNYNLQKQISALQQQNTVLGLQNQNMQLNNQYLASSQYADLTARQDLGLAAPGETVLLVPNTEAMKYVDPSISVSSISTTDVQPAKTQPKIIRNLEAWRDFLLGRTILSD